jgi:hypothetical protein
MLVSSAASAQPRPTGFGTSCRTAVPVSASPCLPSKRRGWRSRGRPAAPQRPGARGHGTVSAGPPLGPKHARGPGASSARRSGHACVGVGKSAGPGVVRSAMHRSTSRSGRDGRHGGATPTPMVDVATARGSQWCASLASGLGTPGAARAATRATDTGRSWRVSYGSNCRCRNPGASPTSSRARVSTVRRQTGCRRCGEPRAPAAGSRGTGGVHGARPGLWGGRRVTGAFTRKATANSLRSCVAPAIGGT